MDDLQMDITLLGMSADDLMADIVRIKPLGPFSEYRAYFNNADVDVLLAETRLAAGVSPVEFDECWTAVMRTFPASTPLLLARALREFVLEGGKLPIIP